jgi:hypothetical protein
MSILDLKIFTEGNLRKRCRGHLEKLILIITLLESLGTNRSERSSRRDVSVRLIYSRTMAFTWRRSWSSRIVSSFIIFLNSSMSQPVTSQILIVWHKSKLKSTLPTLTILTSSIRTR